MAAQRSDLKQLAENLAETVEKVFRGPVPLQFSEKPAIVARDIIEYDGRMRVSGMELFNGPTFISAVNFYKSSKEQQEGKSAGAIVVYLKEDQSEVVLKAAGHKSVEDDDGNSAMTGCGELCKIIAENFKQQLSSDIILSAPKNYHNYVPSGIDFSFDQYTKYEISFLIKGEKCLAVDLTLTPMV